MPAESLHAINFHLSSSVYIDSHPQIWLSNGCRSGNPIRTNLRTQGPVCRATLEKLGRMGMLSALVHLATGTHTALDTLESRAKRVGACQSFEERTGAIADDLRQFDHTALLILPGGK